MLNYVSQLTGRGGAGRFEFRGREAPARLKEKGIELQALQEMASVLVTSAGGRLDQATVYQLLLTSSYIVPLELTGSVDCVVTADCKREAVTLALALPAPLPWCGICGGAE